MNLQEIEERIAPLNSRQGVDFLFELLRSYGIPKAAVTRLRSGDYDKANGPDEVLWRNKVYFRDTELDDGDLYAAIDSARDEQQILDQRPRFLILTNANRLVAADLTAGDTLDVEHGDLGAHATFFLPWAGIEKTRIEEVNPADIKAAEKMARLYDEVTRHNTIESPEEIHDLNVFFSRLLFCFFSEDTGVFDRGSFTNAIGSFTRDSGEDLHSLLDELFAVLNKPLGERDGVSAHLRDFGHVNGSLFECRIETPRFSAKARKVILECGTLDWAQINPDIFGSMIQAVVHPGQREGLGMHYTSVENIMKVIRPLFLDELEERLEAAAAVDRPADVLVAGELEETAAIEKAVKRLDRFIDELARIQVFDPACGSGNFLVIAYKELRRLEHQALQRIAELDPSRAGLFKLSRIELESFHGIEIDDFAHEIAILSLWLAKHQMNREFGELFGAEIPLIPLKESGNVVCGNAARMKWETVCDPADRPTYVLGNPPYQGGTRQSEAQKEELVQAFEGRRVNKYMDYVSIWLYKGAKFVHDHGARVGMVATNSVVQGSHVEMLWPHLLSEDVEIAFAYAPFRWSNLARGNAGVTCTILGLAPRGSSKAKSLYTTTGRHEARHINPYLVPDGNDVVVGKLKKPLSGLPPMVFGSMPRDGGHLLMSRAEADALVAANPGSERFIKRFGGAQEAISGNWRSCLWIADRDAASAESVPEVARRLELVRAFRERSKAESTRDQAANPHRFVQRAHKPGPSIIVPSVSSERREYIPMGFLDGDTVISNAANAVYNAEPWLFGLIQSRMHMAWVRAVAGRLKTDYRYSAVLVYNTFPVPALTDAHKRALRAGALRVLGAREQFAGHTLAELYDPDDMPGGLREAHRALDEVVDGIYRKRPFESDEERLQLLFELYEAAVDGDADDHA